MKINSFVLGIGIIVGCYAALIGLFGAVNLLGFVEVNWHGYLHHAGESTSPILPVSVQYMYMFFICVGVVLFFTSSKEKIEETVTPINNFFCNPEKKAGIKFGQYSLCCVLPFLFGFIGYNQLTPKFSEPIALRVIHPAPPSSLKIFGQTHNLLTLENPNTILKEKNPVVFKQRAHDGGVVFFKNCFFCHGDFLDGKGMTAQALNPVPANFQDVGTIAMLMEGFLFWRIGTGGPGLPDESWPWQSAMPIWQNILTEQETWDVITFLYDYTPPAISPRTF